MKKLTGLSLFLLLTLFAQAQNSVFKGIVTDSVNKQTLQNALITAMKAKDSTLISFTRTNNKGEFSLKNVPDTGWVIWISYPNYADYTESIKINPSTRNFYLTTKAQLLQEVIVKQRVAAIRIKGD
ncbi:MAG: carboxypeptidase-like regulatory domain-containing protein, partial [Chitinophagaceae bacterium]